MFGKSIRLFSILGFEVRIDLSWLILALLVTWTLAEGVFPNAYEGFTAPLYWWMGALGAIGLFASILFHEFSHSLVARRFGLPMKGITLFIFGGVAEMDDEPPGPKAEFLMAIAGPASSVVLGAVFYVIAALTAGSAALVPAAAVLGYLALINWVLAVFNLIPAFPLDGGRVLRAGLWHWKKDLRRATRTASQFGRGFGLFLILFGIMNVIMGNMIGGIWQFMIGMFLRSAAEMSYQQVLLRGNLAGETVERFMSREPVTAPPSISVQKLVDDYVYRYHFKMFPVHGDGRLLGCVSTRRIREVPQEEWDRRTVGEILDGCSEENSVAPGMDAMKAFSLMGRTGKSRLMVIDKGRLIGVVSLKDITRHLSLKMELEENGEKSAE